MGTSRRRCIGRIIAGLILLICVVVPAFGKHKDDVLVLKNGDRLTGEIKGLQHGELSFKSSYMKESMVVDWNEVASVSSKDDFIVTLTSGEKMTGILRTSPETTGQIREFQLVVDGTIRNLSQPTIIRVDQRESKFWTQVNGSADAGFTYASGNNSADITTAVSASYNTQKYTISLSTSSQFSRSTAESTNRHEFNSQNLRMFSQNWFGMSYIDLLMSDQQQLALRSTWGGGSGRRIVRTPRTSMSTMFGGVYTHEKYSGSAGDEPVKSNGEVLLGMNFSTFRFKTTDISSEVLVFPSMTDPGRVRLNTQSDVKVELVKDLYWNFRFYENFDSRPPVSAPRNDLGITTSLGWTF